MASAAVILSMHAESWALTAPHAFAYKASMGYTNARNATGAARALGVA